VERCVAIGAVPLSAFGLALSHLQRQAICKDPAWNNGFYEADAQPSAGLALARGLAMCSYKSADLFQERYARRPNRNDEKPAERLLDRYNIAGYLDYQGEIFVRRFDANSYLVISKAMDNFDFGLDADAVLRRIQSRVLMVGISSDWLFPAADVIALTKRMQGLGVNAQYVELESDHGHDAFLADVDLLVPLVKPFLHENEPALT
jgi:homoserine O-acetyltransferase